MRRPRCTPAAPTLCLALALGSIPLGACGSGDADDGDATVGTDGATGTESTPGTTPGTTLADTSAGSAEGDPTAPGCGNGIQEGDEQCDDGEANSDSQPDACRTDCRTAHCADGVVDPGAGEECDDGSANGNDPDACRDTCLLPSCGDGVQDLGEPCDDGNEAWGDTCYACSNLWYFVLNSPDLAGGGDVSILRSTREGPPVAIVQGDASYNGVRQLALGPAGAVLYALQSQGAVDRVLALDPLAGTLVDEYALDAAVLGADGELQAMARGSDGLLWIAALVGGTTRLVSIDPAAGTVGAVTDLGDDLGVVDMTADDASALYVTTGTGNQLIRVELPGLTTSVFADGGDGLSTPIGVTYDPVHAELWIANNPTGAPAQLLRGDLAGAFTAYSTAAADADPYVRGVAIDVGGVALITQRAYDRVVAVQAFDAIQPFFTRLVDAPTDLEILDMAP